MKIERQIKHRVVGGEIVSNGEDLIKDIRRQRRNELKRMRYARDPEKYRNCRRKYRLQHREEANRKSAECHKANLLDPEKRKRENARKRQLYKKQSRAKKGSYYAKNREAIRQKQRSYYAKNREAIGQKKSLYYLICKSLRTNGVETQIRTALALENLNV